MPVAQLPNNRIVTQGQRVLVGGMRADCSWRFFVYIAHADMTVVPYNKYKRNINKKKTPFQTNQEA